jgi:hypothetical protein
MTTNPSRKKYRLVTVNTAPERAKIIIGRVVEAVKDVYAIDYVANAESTYFSGSFAVFWRLLSGDFKREWQMKGDVSRSMEVEIRGGARGLRA